MSNPNERRKYISELYINSKNRINPANESNDITIENVNFPSAQIISATLKYFKMNNTIYNISSGNNSFQILDSTGDVTISFPARNYTADDFVGELNTLLNATTDDYTVSLNKQTGLLTIESSFPNFEINPNASSNQFLYKLGFLPSVTYTSLAGILVSEIPIDLTSIKTIFMTISGFPNKVITSNGIVFNYYIDVNCPFGSVIKYDKKQILVTNRIEYPDEFVIRLYDERKNFLMNNNADYEMILELELQNLY